jgi:lipoate-protein ligase A
VLAWRLLDSGAGSGPANLALDEAIFAAVRARASPPTLRFYRWSAPTLTIGYAQDRDRDVDRDACRERGVAVVRRITGGRAVLHDAEVTYSVSVPAAQPGFGSGLDEAYRMVAAGLVAGLRLLGVHAAVPAPGPRSPGRPGRPGRRAACFASTARHEIAVGGRKLVGSAQRREGGAFLQHGSILLQSHEAPLGRLLRGEGPPVGAAAMTALAELLPAPPTAAAVVAALGAGCAQAWGVRLVPGALTAAEREAALALEHSRYRAERWNAGRRCGGEAP